ncbi:MAG: ring-opening amidohydrolase [Betaproteobacteria bacterium]
MRVQKVSVQRVACTGPGDLSAVRALIASGALNPRDIVAVMGKTEGNGCVNDHTREYASVMWAGLLAEALGCSTDEAHHRVALVMSGGTEGVLSPHFTVFSRSWTEVAQPASDKRMVIGCAQTAAFAPEHLGRLEQARATADTVRAAMRDAGLTDPADVHFVQVKCPLLTSTKVGDCLSRGLEPVTRDTYESMGYSRGASALGVAMALGETDAATLKESDVLSDWGRFSSRASVSAGIELDANVVIVFGQSAASASDVAIGHAVMRDAIDARSVRRMLVEQFGLDPDRDGGVDDRLVNLLAKAEASPDGRVRGSRHTMLNDSDIHSTRHARAAVGAVLASVAGHSALYVSGGAEHQGPPGGGPVAAIVRIQSTARAV